MKKFLKKLSKFKFKSGNFSEIWDSFLKFSQFFGHKREFLANFAISEKIETFISENLKIFGYDVNFLTRTPCLHCSLILGRSISKTD